jgi:hypothetical protein
MKITKRQLRRIIKEEKAKALKEYYPIGGDEPSPQWEAFKDAAYEVAVGFIDAGMEADGILGAMQDEIEQMINDMASDSDPEWDEADQDLIDQRYANKMAGR